MVEKIERSTILSTRRIVIFNLSVESREIEEKGIQNKKKLTYKREKKDRNFFCSFLLSCVYPIGQKKIV